MRRLLLDLDPYGGTDPFGMFPLFLNPLTSQFFCTVLPLAGVKHPTGER